MYEKKPENLGLLGVAVPEARWIENGVCINCIWFAITFLVQQDLLNCFWKHMQESVLCL
jgi:hypothetical protein